MASPVDNLIWDLFPGGFLKGLDNLEDGDPGSGAQVVDLHPCERWLHNLLESSHVPFGDVHDVDVVAAACSFIHDFADKETSVQ